MEMPPLVVSMKSPIVTLLVAALMFGTVQAQAPLDLNLPDLGEPADVALSPKAGMRLGKQIVGEMYQANYIVNDPQLATFLNAIGWRLAHYGSPNPPDFHFYPIADNDINAFALPGASIGVNVGTIVAATNESELAAVMAHEEAHVTQRHIARSANQSPIDSIATWAAILAAIIAARGSANAVLGGLLAGQSINAQREINYTRGHEMEADRIGIRTLAKAGFDPMAMADFFSKLQQQTRLYGSVPQLLLDHPVNTTRIAEATERAAQYPTKRPPYSVEFDLMQARGRVLETDLPNDAVSYFASVLEAGHDTPGNRYGYAMALQQLSENQKALTALQPLLKRYPKQRNVELLQAQLLLSAGQTQQALQVNRQVLADNPAYAPAILQSADALIQSGQPQRAREILLSHTQSYITNPDTYRLLARAARAVGDTAEAAYQMANYLSIRGDKLGALDQINAGLSFASISPDARARLRAKRQELIASIPPRALREHQQSRG